MTEPHIIYRLAEPTDQGAFKELWRKRPAVEYSHEGFHDYHMTTPVTDYFTTVEGAVTSLLKNISWYEADPCFKDTVTWSRTMHDRLGWTVDYPAVSIVYREHDPHFLPVGITITAADGTVYKFDILREEIYESHPEL